MKISRLSLFSAKSNFGEDPEASSVACKSQGHSLPRRLLLIPLRSPNDQLQIVAFPLMGCVGHPDALNFAAEF
jgi:hypothetical protein